MLRNPTLRWLLGALALGANLGLHAQMAQDPLLSRTAAVEPNIVFIFDDSASMISTAIYQYSATGSGGTQQGYQGSHGPNNDADCLSITSSNCVWIQSPPPAPYGRSPDVNLIYYDPRVTYKRRVNADGSLQAAGSTTGITSFDVYFYKPPVVNFYAVSTVGVTNPGFGYSTTPTATFSTAPSGGTQATATVQTTVNYRVNGVVVNNPGYGYGSTVGVQFNNPPAGGTAATGTVTTQDVNSVNGFTISSRGYGFPSSGVTAVFNSPGPNGVQATVTNVTTVATNQLSNTVNISNTGGSCFGTITATVPAPQTSGGVQATLTATRNSSNKLGSVTVTNPGSGYTSAPTITFSGCSTSPVATTSLVGTYMLNNLTLGNHGAGYTGIPTITFSAGTAAVVTPTVTASKSITGVTITNPGSGYTSPPVMTLSSAGGGTGFAATVTEPPTNVITGITVTNPGSGYKTQPTLTLGNTGGGSGATFSYTYTTTQTGGVNDTWDGTLNPNGLKTNYGPVSTGDYFSPYKPDAGSPLAAGADANVTYPTTASIFTAAQKYPKFAGRTDCVAQNAYCTGVEELQNYANWKLYHSNRVELAKTGIGLAFQPLNPTFRLGWGTLGGISGQGSTSSQCGSSGTGALTKGVRLYNSTTQQDFLTWLYSINTVSGPQVNVLCTPSRYALDNVGRYYTRADNGGPWAPSPTGNGSIIVSGVDSTHASCRRAYSMLMTDGYYNDSSYSLTGSTSTAPGNWSFPSGTDFDSTSKLVTSSPQTYQYTPVGPYSDNRVSGTKASNSLADVAMKYWVTDLRPDLGNNVKAVSSDPAYWQHMTFYAVGLGLIGTIDATDPNVLQSLSGTSARTLDWPTAPQAGDDTRTIDDMWHATVNSRGKLLNAKTASALNSAIQQMMSDISAKEGTQAGVAVSAPSLTKDTRKYTPTYTPITWTGNVTAYNLDQTNGNQTTVAWQVEKPTTDPTTNTTTYSSSIPSAASRNIYVGNGTTGGNRAVAFTYSAMGALRNQMGSATVVTQALVDYLRGDPTNEDTDTSGTAPTGIYRPRQTRLGDIVNSTPVFVKNSVDLNYDKLPSSVAGQSTYRAFVNTKNTRTEGVLFVGANDGMLHGFRDGTYDSSGNTITTGGAEVFAYVPNAILPTLVNLSNKAYTHQYYVDGPNTETDAYIGGSWTNIVLGSTGGGAGAPSSSGVSPQSAVFAIDTTSLNTSVTGMDNTSVLWEVGSQLNPFAELGYVLTDIQAGVTPGGQWVAIFGNGYESKSCQASLFVVNMANGALLKELKTGVGSCTTGSKNGLGGVRLVRNSNQQVIGAYAGDLLGNMWKFNLNSSATSGWGVDLAGAPLFKAGATQPITAQPVIIPLPLSGAANPSTGYMVVFGTGKFYEVADITSTTQQTLYGIWDTAAFGATSVTGVALTDTTKLVQQTIGSDQTGANGNTYAAISTNSVDYTGSTPKRGWYMNLPKTGQRNVYPLDLLATRYALADTISPSNVSLDPCSNTTGGTGFQYIFDALTGAGPTEAILDTNGDGSIGTGDLVVSGVAGAADGRNVSIVITSNAQASKYANVSAQSGSTLVQISCRLLGTCLTTTTGIKHQVRQLFLR